MPHALTPKQAAFCQHYIATGNASEAYRRAYDASRMKPASIGRKAAEVLEHAGVAAEIARMKARTANEHGITVASLAREFEQARLLALELRQVSAAVAASNAKMKLAGLDRITASNDDAPPPSKIDVTIRRARGSEP